MDGGGPKFSESCCPDLTYIYILHLVMQGEITHLVVGTDIKGNLFNNAVNYEIWRKNKAENHTECNVTSEIVWCLSDNKSR